MRIIHLWFERICGRTERIESDREEIERGEPQVQTIDFPAWSKSKTLYPALTFQENFFNTSKRRQFF